MTYPKNHTTDGTLGAIALVVVLLVTLACVLILRAPDASPQIVERVSLDTPVEEVKPAGAPAGQDAATVPSASSTHTPDSEEVGTPSGEEPGVQVIPAAQDAPPSEPGPPDVEVEIGDALVIEAPLVAGPHMSCEIRDGGGLPHDSGDGSWWRGGVPQSAVTANPDRFRNCTLAADPGPTAGPNE